MSTLRITEIFLSIQGESSHAGRHARSCVLTGCPMRCVGATASTHSRAATTSLCENIFTSLRNLGCPLVEVTGGEPSTKDCVSFHQRLCDRGYEVLIETGGFVSTENVDPRASIILDIKCPASGEPAKSLGQHSPPSPGSRGGKFVVANLETGLRPRKTISRLDLRPVPRIPSPPSPASSSKTSPPPSTPRASRLAQSPTPQIHLGSPCPGF